MVGDWGTYRLRLERKRRLWRAFRRRRELHPVSVRTGQIRRGDILLFCTQRNERIRLPYFLRYYRDLGVNHFFFVDNDSDDGSRDYLAEQADCSLWTTQASYRRARFGVDWLNWLQMRHGHGHWTLVVDPDEFFVYPFCDTRPLGALTDWLDTMSIRSFPAMLLDMYPGGALDAQPRGPEPDRDCLLVRQRQLHDLAQSDLPEPVDPGRAARPDDVFRGCGACADAEQDPAGEMASVLLLCQFDTHAAATRAEPDL